jgi:GGDEF domain-containing protein
MSMVSIKRHISQSEEEAALHSVILLLLDGMATRMVRGDQGDYEAFHSDMERICDSARAGVPADALLVIAGSAVQALEGYSQRTTRFIRKQGAELQNIISMLTRTVISIGTGSDRSVQRLREIGNHLEKAVELEDVQTLRARLSDCLENVREETLRQKTENDQMVAALQRQIAVSGERTRTISQAPDLDPVTGLPTQEAAESALQELVRKPGKRYVVTAVVNRMQPINARFGHATGDDVLRTFKELFQEQLSPGDQLFRWSGPALVGMLERPDALEAVRAQVRKMLDRPTKETMFEVAGRQVLIPISSTWLVFMLIPPASTAVKQIQTFIASQGNRDYA